MAGDILPQLLQMVLAEMGDKLDAATLYRIEARIRVELGGDDHYIARRSKGLLLDRLEAAEQADQHRTTAELSRMLGVSERRVKQLRALRGPKR